MKIKSGDYSIARLIDMLAWALAKNSNHKCRSLTISGGIMIFFVHLSLLKRERSRHRECLEIGMTNSARLR